MATIAEDYVSFETAKLLKEKGFNEPVTELNRLLFKEGEKPILKITQQKAMKWLRECQYSAKGLCTKGRYATLQHWRCSMR